MKGKIVWLAVTFSMLATLLAASCVPTSTPAPTPTPTPVPSPTPAPTPTVGPEMVQDSLGRLVEKPRYGGTFTMVLDVPDTGFDDVYTPTETTKNNRQTHEALFMGDWTRGPTGTGELDFLYSSIWIPEQAKGGLAESWEIPDPNTLIFHIRKGVRWHDKPPMNGRELTADDVVFNIKRINDIPSGNLANTYPKWLQSVKATDKYTVVVQANDGPEQRTYFALQRMAAMSKIYPPEVIQKYGDARDWRNSIGTGPFVLVDFVAESSMTFKRNPNYWGKDPLHPENQVPYLDTLIFLDIRDASTTLAALRAGKLDFYSGITKDDAQSLLKTNPELKYRKYLNETTDCIHLRVDKPALPFDDVRVRQALHMAINRQAIKDGLYGGDAELLTYPIPPIKDYKGAYTPLEELPANIRELFEYNPDKAKKLLAEAGYPNGFKTSILIPSLTEIVDLMSIVKADWAKIGVDLTLDLKDWAVYRSQVRAGQHQEMTWHAPGLATGPYREMSTDPASPWNLAKVNDPYINERRSRVQEWKTMSNPAERDRIEKESALHILEQAYSIQLSTPYRWVIWQPWLRSYSGELITATYYHFAFAYYIWIDQQLKVKMTGRK